MAHHTTLPHGIFPPVPTFFDATDDLDLDTLRQHITWLAEHPLPGILALGSNGEAMHLDDDERIRVVEAARSALDVAGTKRVLLVGTADLSTRGTIARCHRAATAGADVAVVLPPFAFPTQMTPAALHAHFWAVAEASPIPVLVYNMPANTANIDLSADLMLDLSLHPNIIGIKDSGGNLVKLARVAAEAKAGFAVLAGSGSFLIPTLAVGGTGAIAAVANIIPDLMAQLHTLWQSRYDSTDAHAQEELARTLQALVIPLNQAVTSGYGVAGLKAALDVARGYGGAPRSPLLSLDESAHGAIRATYHQLITAVAK